MSYMAELQSILTPSAEIEEHFIVNGREIVGEYEHIVVEGDENSNTIYITMNDTFDGKKLSSKKIEIPYTTPDGYTDIATPEVTTSGSTIRLAWLLDATVARLPGKVEFSILVTSAGYEWKTLSTTFTVEKGHSTLGTDIPAPERNWVAEVQEQTKAAVETANKTAKQGAELLLRLQNVIGSFMVTEYVEGLTSGMKINLLYPVNVSTWSVWIAGKKISGELKAGDAFVSASELFGNDDITVKLNTEKFVIVTTAVFVQRHDMASWGTLQFAEIESI